MDSTKNIQLDYQWIKYCNSLSVEEESALTRNIIRYNDASERYARVIELDGKLYLCYYRECMGIHYYFITDQYDHEDIFNRYISNSDFTSSIVLVIHTENIQKTKVFEIPEYCCNPALDYAHKKYGFSKYSYNKVDKYYYSELFIASNPVDCVRVFTKDLLRQTEYIDRKIVESEYTGCGNPIRIKMIMFEENNYIVCYKQDDKELVEEYFYLSNKKKSARS